MCKTYYKDNSAIDNIEECLKNLNFNDLVLLCIGTDKCIGDSLGPLVGEFLEREKLSIPIYGTLENPVHALNVKKVIHEIKAKYPNSITIVIDASLGNEEDIGFIHVLTKTIKPGMGVGKTLPSYGNVSILGVVDEINENTDNSLFSIRLNFVMRMAEIISKAIINTYNNSLRKVL